MIVLRTVMAGPDGVHQPGERVSISPERERALVDGGYAVFVKSTERGETAVARPRETAAMPPVRRGRGER